MKPGESIELPGHTIELQGDGEKAAYFSVRTIEGHSTLDVLAEILPNIIKTFPWPKAMRWGVASAEPGALRWVRPLHSILATFGRRPKTPISCPSKLAAFPLAMSHMAIVSWRRSR